MFSSLRFSALNVALWYFVVSVAVLAVFATSIWIAWHATIAQDRTEQLRGDAQHLTQIFAVQGAPGLAAAIDARVATMPVRSRQILLLADAGLSKRAGNLAAWPRAVAAAAGAQTASIDVGGRVVSATLFHAMLPGGYHLLVGLDIERFQKIEALFLYGLLGCAATVLLVAVCGGLLIRRALLARVHGISQTSAAIVEGDLSHRLPTFRGEDELEMLTRTINAMLDQIEHLVLSVRNVSNAVAHDLRTPLAELRSRLEELVVTRPPADETFAEIEGAIADTDRVIAIFNALLRLAEIDSGTRRAGFVQVDLGAVAAEVAEFYQPVADLKGIALTFHAAGVLRVPGDPLLLAQAIANLVDNALKYAQQNGVILVAARRGPGQRVEIVVCDDGPGVGDDEKSKVVERFYRSDASRGTPGVGLGLSLVAAVARLHGGALELRDNRPGLCAALLVDPDNLQARPQPPR
ncbi:MAG: sensor histidine kinase [Massilia sp.]|nr:sensor histidine kinase [Massilia sp.]